MSYISHLLDKVNGNFEIPDKNSIDLLCCKLLPKSFIIKEKDLYAFEIMISEMKDEELNGYLTKVLKVSPENAIIFVNSTHDYREKTRSEDYLDHDLLENKTH